MTETLENQENNENIQDGKKELSPGVLDAARQAEQATNTLTPEEMQARTADDKERTALEINRIKVSLGLVPGGIVGAGVEVGFGNKDGKAEGPNGEESKNRDNTEDNKVEVSNQTAERTERNEKIEKLAEKAKKLKDELGIDFLDPENEELLGENFEQDFENGETVIDIIYEMIEGGKNADKNGSMSGLEQEDVSKVLEKIDGNSGNKADLYEISLVDSDGISQVVNGAANLKDLSDPEKSEGKTFTIKFKGK